MYKKLTTGHCTRLNGEEFNFVVYDVIKDDRLYFIEITSGEHKGKYSFIFEQELDDYIVFDKPKKKEK